MANMFSGNIEKEIPKNLKDCYAVDSTSQNLWIWCQRLEGWGKFLFWVIIIVGLIISILAANTTKDISDELYRYTDTESSVNSIVLIISFGITAICAFIEYCTYHAIALLIASLATIVQNTKITANVALYNTAKKDGLLNKETENSASSTQFKSVNGTPINKNSWICKECRTENNISNMSCKNCGKYR